VNDYVQTRMSIACLDLSSEGRYFAVGGGDEAKHALGGKGEVSVWDLTTARLLQTWDVPMPVRGVVFSPDGSAVAIIGSSDQPRKGDGWLEARRIATGVRLFARPFAGKPTGAVFAANGGNVLVIDEDGLVRALQSQNGEELWRHPLRFSQPLPRGLHARLLPVPLPAASTGGADRMGFIAPDQCAAISPDGSRIALLLDVRQPMSFQAFHAPELTTFLALSYDPHNDRLAAAASNGGIYLWNLRGGQAEKTELRGHKGPVSGVSFSGDGKRLASCGSDGTVRIWDVEQGLELLVLLGYDGASAVRFAHDVQVFKRAGREPDWNAQDLGLPRVEPLVIAHGKNVTILKPH
jgi:WD40 repeat protein